MSGVIWEGDRTQVDAFEFAENVTVNVINVSDKDWNDKPIETVIGTDGIDLIFGNASANLIDGKVLETTSSLVVMVMMSSLAVRVMMLFLVEMVLILSAVIQLQTRTLHYRILQP